MNLPFVEVYNSLDDLSGGRSLKQCATILMAQRLADAFNEDADGPIRARAVWIDFDSSESTKELIVAVKLYREIKKEARTGKPIRRT